MENGRTWSNSSSSILMCSHPLESVLIGYASQGEKKTTSAVGIFYNEM